MYVLYCVCCASYCGGVFLVLLVGPVEGDFDLPTASLKGEYGAVTECGGARCPFASFGGSVEPGHFFCSSCILLSGSPTMWYFAHSMGGQRTTFWGCGMGGNLGAGRGSTFAESLRPTPGC